MHPGRYVPLPPYLPAVDDMEKLRLVLPRILVLKGFVNEDECRLLREVYNRAPNPDKDTSIPMNVFTEGPAGELFSDILYRMRKLLCVNFEEDSVFDMGVMTKHNSQTHSSWIHADNCVWSPAHGGYIMNHTPLRTYTVMLYFSEDVDGGELNVGSGPGPAGNLYSMDIPAEDGTLVCMPASEYFHHSVNPIRRGDRYALVTWYMREEDMSMAPRPLPEIQEYIMENRDLLWTPS